MGGWIDRKTELAQMNQVAFAYHNFIGEISCCACLSHFTILASSSCVLSSQRIHSQLYNMDDPKASNNFSYIMEHV